MSQYNCIFYVCSQNGDHPHCGLTGKYGQQVFKRYAILICDPHLNEEPDMAQDDRAWASVGNGCQSSTGPGHLARTELKLTESI